MLKLFAAKTEDCPKRKNKKITRTPTTVGCGFFLKRYC